MLFHAPDFSGCLLQDMLKVTDIYQSFIKTLINEYEREEASAITTLAFEHVLNFRRIDISLNKEKEVSDSEAGQFHKILEELKRGKPIQYALGYAWFWGMKIKVDENVLIPRPETEELVAWVIKDVADHRIYPALILDVCTGSGCIALALKQEFREAHVQGTDISKQAIHVARMNALEQKLDAEFLVDDILHTHLSILPDIIISNPPYVTHGEQIHMNRRVLDYEPHRALFVPGGDPLIFYRAISKWALKHLSADGKLFFEINEAMVKEVYELLSSLGFSRIDFRKDFQGKIRMFRAIK